MIAGLIDTPTEAIADWSAWLDVGTLVLVLALWLTGRLTRPADCDARVSAAVSVAESHQRELSAERVRHTREIETLTSQIATVEKATDQIRTAMEARIEHLSADRDAWRSAHWEANKAREAAEKAATALMETSQISLALLDALNGALSRAKES